MYSKSVLRDCDCIHCQEKLEQIKRSRVYWDKLILDKKLDSFSYDLPKIDNQFSNSQNYNL